MKVVFGCKVILHELATLLAATIAGDVMTIIGIRDPKASLFYCKSRFCCKHILVEAEVSYILL